MTQENYKYRTNPLFLRNQFLGNDTFRMPVIPKVRKIGYIVPEDFLKGSGSAEGGKWKPSPNKPDDQRLVGKPGEENNTIATNKNGETYDTKTTIGEDGRATVERQ